MPSLYRKNTLSSPKKCFMFLRRLVCTLYPTPFISTLSSALMKEYKALCDLAKSNLQGQAPYLYITLFYKNTFTNNMEERNIHAISTPLSTLDYL